MENGIHVRNLSKTYRTGQAAVVDLSLDVRPGEVYCLLGHNGAGKSTTLKMLLGLISPTSGNAWVDGLSVSDAPEEVRRSIAYVPENVSLYGELTVGENLDLFRRLGRANSTNEYEDYSRLLQRAGLPAVTAGALVSSLSKGMRQKVALAIAISRDSQVFMLDEPMSGLDPFTVDEIAKLIVSEKERGKAVFMVTHELNSVEQTAETIGFMHNGRLSAELSREEFRGKDIHAIYKSLLNRAATAA
jgi:ABC-2 type transport system ATP-binding protein